MKLLITSDIHNHLFGSFAINKNTTENSRYRAIVNVLNQIHTYAVSNKVDCIIINGDIFETKNTLNAFVNNLFWDWCLRVSKSNIKLIINVGNHDISSLGDESITLLHPYKSIPNVTVVEKATVINSDIMNGFCNMAVIPFRRNVIECKEAILQTMEYIESLPKNSSEPMNLLFYHGAILGAELTGREFSDANNSMTVEELHPEFFDYCFLGHFHTQQYLNEDRTVLYTGSPLHHTMADAGQQRGFFVLDIRSNKLEMVKTEYPSFNKIEITSVEDLDKIKCLPTVNYYDIKIKTSDVTENDLKNYNVPNIKLTWDVDKPVTTRNIEITATTDIKDVVNSYVDSIETKLDKTKLKVMGMEFIKKFKGNR